MNPITMPYHLFIPAMVSLLFLLLIAIGWKPMLLKSKRKKFWFAVTIFLTIYLIVLGTAIYTDIYCQWDLNKHDLNMNGIFESNEINPYQQAAFQRLINDTGRNFAVISGLIFAGVISFVVFFITQGFEKYKKLKNEEETREDKKI